VKRPKSFNALVRHATMTKTSSREPRKLDNSTQLAKFLKKMWLLSKDPRLSEFQLNTSMIVLGALASLSEKAKPGAP